MTSDNIAKELQTVNIQDTLSESYLDYSMSVIVGRALPDIRDGLKPVHRRILYAMNELNLGPKTPYKKSARIVGDVVGKYHPHGDNSVYDALVRMAQEFSMRQILVEGQGNFGSVDGDGAAAMRYTEARFASISEEVLRDIDKDTVDFIDNYDGSMQEPEVLPSKVPLFLVNGSEGIAVGMATKSPPHNLAEILHALIMLTDDETCDLEALMTHIQGPDFPTGGIIFGKKGIVDAYKTGRGRIQIKAKTHIETKKDKETIVIDELPYQVNKAKLVEHIAELSKNKEIEGISEIRDESDRNGMRVVIELKRNAFSEIILNNLFKSTNMLVTFGIIFLAIVNKEPKILSLKAILLHFLNHRKTIVIRRSLFELEKARAKAHILEGLKIALDNIDPIIKLIRAAANTAEATAALIEHYNLSEKQSTAILDMRLQKLTGLEREKIETEYKELLGIIAELEAVLKSDAKLREIIKAEFQFLLDKFTSPRLTVIEENYESHDDEDLIPKENMIVTITHKGYIKRVSSKTYEIQNRGGKGKVGQSTYDDDFVQDFFEANTHDTLLIITNKGYLYWLKVYRIPEASRTAKGKAIVNLIELANDEQIQTIIPSTDFSENKALVFFTKMGIIKKTNLSEYANVRKSGIRAINLDNDDEVINASIIQDHKMFLILTKEGMSIKFDTQDVRAIGRTARGVRAIKFKLTADQVVGAITLVDDEEQVLTVSEKGIGKRTRAEAYRLQSRGGSGVIAMKITGKTGKLIDLVKNETDKDLMLLTSDHKMIRVDMNSIRQAGRNTSGVKIVNLNDNHTVIKIALCKKESQENQNDSEDEG